MEPTAPPGPRDQLLIGGGVSGVTASTSWPENLSAADPTATAVVQPSRCRSLGSLRRQAGTPGPAPPPQFDRLAGVSASLSWMLPSGVFTERRRGSSAADTKGLGRSVKKFYKRQDSLIDRFDRIYKDIVQPDGEVKDQDVVAEAACSIRLAQLSFFVNLALTLVKAVAIALSGSLSVISSLIDSMIDLVSGVVVWIANRQVKSRNPYYYPQGKTRLEPISIVILAVIMSTSTVQIIIRAVESIVARATAVKPGSSAVENFSALLAARGGCCLWCNGSSENATLARDAAGSDEGERFSVYTFVLVASVIAIKLTLYFLCARLGSTSSTEALAQDHRNDCVSNSTVLVMTVLNKYLWPYCDAIGALVISGYIFYTWVLTLKEQVRLLAGYTAHPDFLKQITYICLNHHRLVREIDTVRAFHIGNNFLVEVDIVLPEDLSLREAHDIGEALQCKLERLEAVERAFVHLDYESEHHPHSEHKQV